MGYPRKKQSFFLIKGLLFSRVPQNFFGPSYFEAALVPELLQQSAPLGKGVPGFKLWQLSMPQNRPSSQSLLLSQSPSLSVHLFSVLQHDHVSLSVNGCPGVPVQSHEIEFTEFQNIEKHRYTGG